VDKNMSSNELSDQLSVYFEWKRELIAKIEFFQNWLIENNLNSFDIEQRLAQGKQLLAEDQLTIALVGEYSRGKTELINALLFSNFGQRILPSQAGRTTMCPTEIYFDSSLGKSFLKLLPIETRLKNDSIQSLKEEEQLWQHVDIDLNSPQQMAEALSELAATKVLNAGQAQALGFDQRMLDMHAEQGNKVRVPVWRHALLSLDNPLLRKGIRFLDTPGLNALGSEPELTISMLPKAQAIIFLLSADAGVTASDMAIWKEFIDHRHADYRAGRFAVLNKIDVLWDDVQGEQHVLDSIQRMRQTTAQQLGIDEEDVIAISAKQALIGKIMADEARIKRSELPHLEGIIVQGILEQKERLICDDLIADIQQMIHGAMAILNQRLASMYERYDALDLPETSKRKISELAKQSHTEHERYYKKLITLKSSRRLLHSQGEILQQSISPLRFKALIKKTRRALDDSWSTLGLMHAMNQFFKQMDAEFESVILEAALADKMVLAIYQRFKADIDARHLQPKTFNIAAQREALTLLKNKLLQFCRQPKMFMTEQTLLIEHFFTTFVHEVETIQKEVYEIAMQWPDQALMPLMQYAQEQKKTLESQLSELKRLAGSSKEMKQQQSELKRIIEKNEQQLAIAEHFKESLQLPHNYSPQI
jgi:hypothetical protein